MACHPADKFISHTDGPFAIVRSCKLCRHSDIVRKERAPGRGWGMREGNKQRGRVIQHVNAEHAWALDMTLDEALRANRERAKGDK